MDIHGFCTVINVMDSSAIILLTVLHVIDNIRSKVRYLTQRTAGMTADVRTRGHGTKPQGERQDALSEVRLTFSRVFADYALIVPRIRSFRGIKYIIDSSA